MKNEKQRLKRDLQPACLQPWHLCLCPLPELNTISLVWKDNQRWHKTILFMLKAWVITMWNHLTTLIYFSTQKNKELFLGLISLNPPAKLIFAGDSFSELCREPTGGRLVGFFFLCSLFYLHICYPLQAHGCSLGIFSRVLTREKRDFGADLAVFFFHDFPHQREEEI